MKNYELRVRMAAENSGHEPCNPAQVPYLGACDFRTLDYPKAYSAE
jgi:hypothetical protein